MHRFTVRSSQPAEMVEITRQVSGAIAESACVAVLVFIPHTTAGVLVNEHADPDVARDLMAALEHVVRQDGLYRHAEGNSAAHVKASLVGTSQIVPVEDGRLALGRWQGIFLAEFDGPRSRTVCVVPLGG